ncbi:hypothetical protein KCTC32420_02939 [Aequorivita nionensis]|jgi:hypothetical protein
MHRLCKDYSDVSNNIYFLELVDKELFHKNKTHNNLHHKASRLFYNSHTRKRIDKRLLASLLLFCVRSLDR